MAQYLWPNICDPVSIAQLLTLIVSRGYGIQFHSIGGISWIYFWLQHTNIMFLKGWILQTRHTQSVLVGVRNPTHFTRSGSHIGSRNVYARTYIKASHRWGAASHRWGTNDIIDNKQTLSWKWSIFVFGKRLEVKVNYSNSNMLMDVTSSQSYGALIPVKTCSMGDHQWRLNSVTPPPICVKRSGPAKPWCNGLMRAYQNWNTKLYQTVLKLQQQLV